MTTKSSNHLEKNSALIQVVVACYYPLLREGISKIIEDDKNIEIVQRVSNLLDLVQVCEEFKFDVLLLDIDLRGINLTKILQLLKKNKNAKVI
ncbi:MAG: response regulator, partial [Thermodesulfobacteriota bacterium]